MDQRRQEFSERIGHRAYHTDLFAVDPIRKRLVGVGEVGHQADKFQGAFGFPAPKQPGDTFEGNAISEQSSVRASSGSKLSTTSGQSIPDSRRVSPSRTEVTASRPAPAARHAR